MADTWTFISQEQIEGRDVKIECHDEGSYRITTTQGADDPGTVQITGSSLTIIPPTDQGREISIEGSTVDEIRQGLLTQGFSETAVNEITGKL